MNYDVMYQIVLKAFKKEFKKPIELIRENTLIKDELNLDSLDRIDLLCAVEDELGVELMDEEKFEDNEKYKKRRYEYFTTKTVGDLVDFLLEELKNVTK